MREVRVKPKRAERFSPQEGQEKVVRRGPSAQRSDKVSLIKRLSNYLGLHFHVLIQTLAGLAKGMTNNLMTIAVIGITLALPATLHVFLDKVQSLGTGWQDSAQISLFLKESVSEQRAMQLMGELRPWREVGDLRYISPDQALADFKKNSGLGDALSLLDENPLPAVVVVSPSAEAAAPAAIDLLLSRLRQLPDVDIAQLDMEWVQRLHSLIHLAERGVLLLGGLLALAVLFVIGNTIRLAIQSRQDEIVVVKLIGGSDAFVRRPFLYNGMWFGLFGGLLAWLMVNGMLVMLDEPVTRLAVLYGSDFALGLVDAQTTSLMLLSGPLLGLLGAWLATGRHIRAIEPA